MNIDILEQLYGSLSFFIAEAATFILKLLIAYVIWIIGKFLINSLVKLINKADIKNWNVDDSIRNTLIKIGKPTAQVVLILVVLDFLGVGTSIIGAFAQGLTFTIAIALGLSFGEALKPDAKMIIEKIKRETNVGKNTQ